MTGVDVAAIRARARAALDAYFARATGDANSGLADYIQRIRKDHRARIVDAEYRGCICGEVLCRKDLLLAWCDELIASYEQKVQEFAQETLRAAVAEQQRDDALAKIARAGALVKRAEQDITQGHMLPASELRAALEPSEAR